MAGDDRYGDMRFVSRNEELLFRNPSEVIVAEKPERVMACLEYIATAVDRGQSAAGLIAYEAAPAFNPDLQAHPAPERPLLWFGLYDAPERRKAPSSPSGDFTVGEWRPLVSPAEYRDSIARIRELIAAGDTYQVNYTFPLEAPFRGNPLAWFHYLCAAQRAEYCAYINMGRERILSASPELFFELEDNLITTRPMKGTRPRGRSSREDERLRRELAESEKDRAENVMIVDLLRNDLGMCSRTGSVRVRSLFDIERYPTVWQMTSTVTAESDAPLPSILRALFPCGSVTGAPKARTMEIIRELEPFPRGVYCGAAGWWLPERRARFNVAIRTVTIDNDSGIARYAVGGGITWDSTPEGEYAECLTKAAVLTHRTPEFELLESIRWDGEYFLLEEHLARLTASAGYFGFHLCPEEIREALMSMSALFPGAPYKIRVLSTHNGAFRVEKEPIPEKRPFRLTLADDAVDETDVFLYHKTTRRNTYEQAMKRCPGYDDVLLWNRRGEITESTIANVVLNIDGELLTPDARCGLLPGVMREQLLRDGSIRETILTREDVFRAKSIYLVNSVRGWIEACFAG